MESDLLKARALSRRYFDATATEAEERELRALLAALPREALDGELRSAAVMMGGFEALARETQPGRPAAKEGAQAAQALLTAGKAGAADRAVRIPSAVGKLPADSASDSSADTPHRTTAAPHRRWNLLLGTGAGIAAALLVGLFFLTRGTVYGYIDGRPVTDPAEAMCATVYFQPLEELSRSFDIADRLLEAAEKSRNTRSEQR
ncbi:hypothetical protein [uncultured Alistipes sp.]|uniref:hypothetical protein n=1 Tax=uncultured Alistipes sp. TaxID=538949 RepID=UPI002665AD44|nr:hypothetical protein [uncultured Alistipes sp.]